MPHSERIEFCDGASHGRPTKAPRNCSSSDLTSSLDRVLQTELKNKDEMLKMQADHNKELKELQNKSFEQNMSVMMSVQNDAKKDLRDQLARKDENMKDMQQYSIKMTQVLSSTSQKTGAACPDTESLQKKIDLVEKELSKYRAKVLSAVDDKERESYESMVNKLRDTLLKLENEKVNSLLLGI